jgi:hypothetical protein
MKLVLILLILIKIYVSNMDKVRGSWIQLHNGELYNL